MSTAQSETPTPARSVESFEATEGLRGRVAELERESASQRERIAELEAHEQWTHETLGAILGTDDSLEAVAKRMKAERDAMRAALEGIDSLVKEFSFVLRRYSQSDLPFGLLDQALKLSAAINAALAREGKT